MMWTMTADPESDFAEYSAYQARLQNKWEEGCAKCDICGKPIDPHFDETEWCYEDEDIRICKPCIEKQMKEVRKINPFFANMVEDALDTFYTTSPTPEGF